jgi:hypothetical protein
VEILVILLLLGVFIGPSAYHLYERWKSRKQPAQSKPRKGPSWGRKMLGMLVPVFLMIIFFAALAAGLYYFVGH